MNANAKRMTTRQFRALKGERPIVMLTAYDALFAALADEAGVDCILVGDSVGNTLLGFETTVPVTLEMMVHHTAAVSRARPRAMVIADLPFGLAFSADGALLNACRLLMQVGGADAIKIEGGQNLAPKLAPLIESGVAVIGHIGLQPQSVRALGGYRRFGQEAAERNRLLEDAKALEAAGCFGVLMEMVEPSVAAEITATLKVPTIGIGCGPKCDGQVLVSTDVLGLSPGKIPSFAKRFTELREPVREAFTAYTQAVRERSFPE
ncbi:MAG: 3-methyl-2-oxobutanoate hydroxymethyltransferase [Opitutales bacterium]